MDALSSFTLQWSDAGPTGPWVSRSLVPSSVSTPNPLVAPTVWYQLTQTTANGVTVPYNPVTLSTLPQGYVTAAPDPNDMTTLIFTWTVPDGLPPIDHFELSGKFLNDSDSDALFLGTFDGDARTCTAPIKPTDDFSNPYTYQLAGIILR